MRIGLRLEPNRLRRWHRTLAERLTAAGDTVGIVFAPAGPAEPGTGFLLAAERTLLGGGRPTGAEPLDAPDVASFVAPHEAAFDLVVDVTHRPALAPGATTLVVAYDGSPGENAALAALLAGAVPVVEIAEGASGVILERLHVSTEMAAGLGGGLDALGARITTVLVALAAAWRTGRHRPAPPAIERLPRGRARKPNRILAAEVARAAAHAVYRTLCEAPHWRIGWRRVTGEGVLERGDLAGPGWQVLPDPGGHFYADPFPAAWRGEEAILFEDLDTAPARASSPRSGWGRVAQGPGRARDGSADAPFLPLPRRGGRGALHDPESSAAGDVALWRCTDFPLRWERVATLLEGEALADATIFRHAGRWWMTAVAYDGAGGYSDVLHLYHAPALTGPWVAHPAIPC